MLYSLCRIYLAKIRNRPLPCGSPLRIFLSLHWLACLCVCALVFQATAGGVGELEDFLSFSPLTGCVVFWAVCLGCLGPTFLSYQLLPVLACRFVLEDVRKLSDWRWVGVGLALACGGGCGCACVRVWAVLCVRVWGWWLLSFLQSHRSISLSPHVCAAAAAAAVS